MFLLQLLKMIELSKTHCLMVTSTFLSTVLYPDQSTNQQKQDLEGSSTGESNGKGYLKVGEEN
jgi:hypothetical protein